MMLADLAQVTQFAQEHPTASLAATGSVLLGGFWALLQWIGNRFVSALDAFKNEVKTDVKSIRDSLTDHAAEDARLFLDVDKRANVRQETLSDTLYRNAQHATDILTAIQLEFGEVKSDVRQMKEIIERRATLRTPSVD